LVLNEAGGYENGYAANCHMHIVR